MEKCVDTVNPGSIHLLCALDPASLLCFNVLYFRVKEYCPPLHLFSVYAINVLYFNVQVYYTPSYFCLNILGGKLV